MIDVRSLWLWPLYRGYARDITVAGSYVGTRLLSGKTLISAIDSPYIQTEKSYLIVLNKVNSPTLRLYWKLELSSFYLQSFCFIKIHHRHVMSYFLSRHSVQVFIFPSVRVWKRSFSTTQTSCCLLLYVQCRNRWYVGPLSDLQQALPNSKAPCCSMFCHSV